MAETRSPSLSELLNRHRERVAAEIRVSLPVRVQTYYQDSQTADVVPLIADVYIDEDGEQQVENLPVIPSVPVQFPEGGGFVLTFPIAAGDTGVILCTDRSLDGWLTNGGTQPQAPLDDRRHALKDAVFLPGVRPNVSPRSSTLDRIFLGRDGANHAPAAREGDSVKVTIPANSFLVSCSGSPAVGVLNPAPVDVTGTITSGSGSVEVSD